jgi:hypothetical protein
MSTKAPAGGMVAARGSKWTVLYETERRGYRRRVMCQCICGRRQVHDLKRVTSGATRQCKRCACSHMRKVPGWVLIGRARYRARKKGRAFDLTVPYLRRLYLKQKGRCALSQLPLTWPLTVEDTRQENFALSLDRVDSRRGYVRGNVQWVHKRINWMKGNMTQSDFIRMCRLVSDTHPEALDAN